MSEVMQKYYEALERLMRTCDELIASCKEINEGGNNNEIH